MMTWGKTNSEYRCPACQWTGPAADLEGQAENRCPKCGAKASNKNFGSGSRKREAGVLIPIPGLPQVNKR